MQVETVGEAERRAKALIEVLVMAGRALLVIVATCLLLND